jgi:hypothetical protein
LPKENGGSRRGGACRPVPKRCRPIRSSLHQLNHVLRGTCAGPVQEHLGEGVVRHRRMTRPRGVRRMPRNAFHATLVRNLIRVAIDSCRPHLSWRAVHKKRGCSNETQACRRGVAVRRNSHRRAGTAKRPTAPKPSTADVQKLVKSISADPTKVKIYCSSCRINRTRQSRKRMPRLLRHSAPKPIISGNNSAPTMSGSWLASNQSIQIQRKENALAHCFSRCSKQCK